MRNFLTVVMLTLSIFAVSARELHANLSNATAVGNSTWNASTGTFAWTAKTYAYLKVTDIAGDLSNWKQLVLKTSNYTNNSYRVDIKLTDGTVIKDKIDGVWENQFWSVGQKTLTLANGLTAAQLAMVEEIRVNTNSNSGSVTVEDLYLVNDEQAAAGTLTCAGFTNLNGNCTYDASTHIFSWTGSNNNTAKMFVMEAGELAKYETLTFTTANYVDGGSYRVLFKGANDSDIKGRTFYSAGSKTITIAEELTADQIAQVTDIRFAGNSNSGSIEIDPSSVKLNRANETLSITTDNLGYATFSSSYMLDLANLPEGLEAYVGTLNGNVLTFTKKEVAVPGNTGLLFKGAASTTYEIPVLASGTPADATNALVASVNNTTLVSDASTYYFVMVKDATEGELTFANLSTEVTVPANKAYVAVPASAFSGAPALRVSFGEDETTAIELVDENEGETVIYDLLGRRLTEPVQGINIINGKKVYIK